MPKFINLSNPTQPDRENGYGYDFPSPYLLAWTKLLQSTVFQAGTYLLTKKFHDHQTGIFKAEGGCNIAGVGELGLGPRSCYFNHDNRPVATNNAAKLAKLITKIILEWNPMDPVKTMLESAADGAGCIVDELTQAVMGSATHQVNPFNGNAISYFFDWNLRPTLDRKYLRYAMIEFGGKTAKQVDQGFADDDYSESVTKRLQEAYRTRNGGSWSSKFWPHSVKIKREGKELKLFINCAHKCNIDGWRTKEEVENFLKSNDDFHEVTP
jgi:hypothetical protein